MKRTDKGRVDLDLYAALFKDIVAWDGNLHRDLNADFQRLRRTVDTRGISFIMIDMPDAGKILDSALSRGAISSTFLPITFGKIVDKSSREFLSCLFEKIFDGSGNLDDLVDPTAVFFLRQVLYLSKKVREECDEHSIRTEVESFRKVDANLRVHSLNWDSDTLNASTEARGLSFLDGYRSSSDLVSYRDMVPRKLLAYLDQVTGIVSSQFSELDWREIDPRHGTGAVADLRTGTDKYQFRNWPSKLEGTFPSTYFAQSREDLPLDAIPSLSLHEPPARLLAVPKTLKGPRLIASEPTAHQYLQQGLMKWLRYNLPKPLRTCIDFTDQEPSRALCLLASKVGSLATVDLSSASDRLSCWVVERALRTSPSLLTALHASRTRWLTNATGVGEKFFIRLKKFAAQGSAVTFPVQSIVYASMAIACILYEGNRSVNSANIMKAARKLRVFGDDIIIPSHAVQSLTLLMDHCDLKVNGSKTHYTGYFRESCGMDAYKGVCVTPGYLRSLEYETSPDGVASWVEVSNNFYLKGLWSLADAMVRMIPRKTRELIPVSSQNLGVLTLRSFLPVSSTGRLRDSRYLHRQETLGLTLEARAVTRRRESHQNLLQYFVEKPAQDSNWSAGFLTTVRLRLRKRWVANY